MEQLGREMALMLLAQISAEERITAHHILPVELLVRASTGQVDG